MDALVAHFHEVGLKGRNRNFFEDALARNIRRAVRGTGYKRIRRGFGRIVVDFYPDANVEEALERAARVFGLAYVGAGVRVNQDMDEITQAALALMQAEPFESFSVRARRSYAPFPHKSVEINTVVGQAIVDATGGPVNLKHPDATAYIELFGTACIVYRRRVDGPGGLPVGTSGKMLGLLSGGIDSPVAAWRMMRRGAEVELVHFHGQPYTDPSSVRQATDLAEALTRYQLHTTLHLIPLGDAQREIVMNTPAELRVILYRRTMMRIAEALLRERKAQAIVTGDSLGQVASQTIENISTVDAATGAEVLRPLIGFDKVEIVNLAQQIDTYDISTRKHQDCCVLFAPRDPATRSSPTEAATAEENLDMDALVGKSLAGLETIELELPELGS